MKTKSNQSSCEFDWTPRIKLKADLTSINNSVFYFLLKYDNKVSFVGNQS